MDKIIYDKYQEWLNCKFITDEEREELKAIEHNNKEIEDRFYTDLAFGTAGMRGIRGIGTNRINKYIVRKVTQGLANLILKKGKKKSCVIAYDCRIGSLEFALNTAIVLTGNGITTYLFKTMHSTPELSFAVREIGAQSGVVITASHNPKEYNGYKVYWDYGGQIVEPHGSELVNEVDKITEFSMIKMLPRDIAMEKGLLVMLDDEIDTKYIEKIKEQRINKEIAGKENLKIVYTPLHGVGGRPVLRVLKECGFDSVFPVREQIEGDGNFPTCSYANPEDPSVFKLGIELADSIKSEIVIATDPDSDRVAIAYKNKIGEWVYPNGNQLAIILLDYILKYKEDIPKNAGVISTIVSTPMLDIICEKNNLKLFRTLTGFKYIGEKIEEFQTGEIDAHYLFGYEESVGYLIGTHGRDKDAIVTTMLIAEMVAKYSSINKNLSDVFNEIYTKYGWYKDISVAITKKGKDGMEEISKIMASLEKLKNVNEIIGKKISIFRDYEKQIEKDIKTGIEKKLELPKSHVIQLVFHDGTHITVRPSGTEPKIKHYYGVVGKTEEEATVKIKEISDKFEKYIEAL